MILRSKPSSRTALMGEQPNPWDQLQPQDATIRHRGAKPPRRCGVLQSLAAQTIPSSLFEMVACYERDRFAPFGRSTSISRSLTRSRYRESLHSMLGIVETTSRLARTIRTANSLPSVLPFVKGFTDMSHCSSLDRSSEEPYLTLGGDKPVIPGVAFIR